ncbi:MAG: putative porin [Bacteroidales bacterium]|jgi:hypothetical protein|nr:putative porin [Bacteroidales bacterium]
MKKYILFLTLTAGLMIPVMQLNAQTENDPIPIVSWKISERLGHVSPAPFDTIMLNFQNRNIPDGFTTAYGYTGNLMQPGQSKIFFDRSDAHRFIFINGFHPFIIRPDNFDFVNTKIPYTRLTYTFAGSSLRKEERISGIFTANINKKWNVGTNFDYVYARGFYQGQAIKQTDFVFFTSYLSDKYVLHAFVGIDDISNFENGGISDDRFISNPEAVSGTKRPVGSKEIPVHFTDAGSSIKDRQYYLTHRYNVGFYRKVNDSTQTAAVNQIDALTSDLVLKGKVFEDKEDTIGAHFQAKTKTEEFVPVTSFIHTFNYGFDSRDFTTKSIPRDYYPNLYLNKLATNDSTRYYYMRNTLGISLLEGFNKYAKAGLSVFLEHEFRNFRLMNAQPTDTLWTPLPASIHKETALYAGAELSKRHGTLLTYDFRGEMGIVGADLGQFKLSGNIRTRFRLWKDTVELQAYGHIYNLTPTFYEERYHSNFFWWDKPLNNQRQVRLGGVFSLPNRNLKLDVGVENLQNYIYFDKNALPAQASENIQVLSARLNQNFRFGILHWDNELAYQTSSNKEILPLPDFSVFSNAYLWFKVVKVLQVQLGADVRFHTRYYAPAYQPATMQFHLQDEVKIGNFPLLNAYVNMYLKKTRFFVMAYNLVGGNNYFSLPHYPVNPFHIRFGISASLND